MAQETELKLQLHAGELPRLLAHPLLATRAPRRQRLLNTYFDTPDLTLMKRRIAVRERRVGQRTLLTVKTMGQSVGGLSRRGEWEGPTTPGAPDFRSLVDDEGLAGELAALADRLVPLFCTDFRRRHWLLEHGQARIEVALDEGRISTFPTAPQREGPCSEPILELELELKDGPEHALFELALALGHVGDAEGALWLMPADRSKAERGMALYLGRTVQPRKAQPTALTASMDPVTALRATALDVLAQLQANIAGLLPPPPAGTLPDPEFVHQARVALRRLRSGLALFREHLPTSFVRDWTQRWKATAAVLGDARNWDVLDDRLLQWLGQRLTCGQSPDAAQPLADWVLAHRLEANRRVAAHLCRPALARQLLAFARDLQALPAAAGSPSLADWADETLRQRLRRLLKQARKAHRLDLEDLHALRIQLKKLRYAQGFLQGLLPADMQDRLPLLEQAQDLMGELNDRVTALQLLQDCALPQAASWRRQLQQEQAQILRTVPRLQHALARLSRP